MNLIEQLGGYEKAKGCLNTPTARESVKDELRSALLQYRREHGIFEVGDYYVYLKEWDGDLDILCKFKPSDWNDHLWNIGNMICHATDAEIKAGHRL